MAGRSRMSREAHVRICEGLGGEVPPAYSTLVWIQDGLICILQLRLSKKSECGILVICPQFSA